MGFFVSRANIRVRGKRYFMVDFTDEKQRLMYRHTTSHVMAQAVKRLWPETKLAIGRRLRRILYDFDHESNFYKEDRRRSKPR
jgi:threonyl-tRNA synthetase